MCRVSVGELCPQRELLARETDAALKSSRLAAAPVGSGAMSSSSCGLQLNLALPPDVTKCGRTAGHIHWIISHTPQRALERLKRMSDLKFWKKKRKNIDRGRVRVKLCDFVTLSFEGIKAAERNQHAPGECGEGLKGSNLPAPTPRGRSASRAQSLLHYTCGLAETMASWSDPANEAWQREERRRERSGGRWREGANVNFLS